MPIRNQIIASLGPSHVEEVQTTSADALRELDTVEKHIRSALLISDNDPVGAYQMAYDAARKSVQALLMAHGLRVTALGGHYAFVRVAKCGISPAPEFLLLRLMRQIRNQIEYPNLNDELFSRDSLNEALQVASVMHAEVKRLISQ